MKKSSFILIPLLFACVEVAFYILVMIFKDKWIESFTQQFIRIIFCIDGIFFVSFAYGLVSVATKISNFFAKLFKWLLYIFVVYIVFWRFQDISIDADMGLNIGSERLFTGLAQDYFPWDWVFLYKAIYNYILPGTSFLFFMIYQERKDWLVGCAIWGIKIYDQDRLVRDLIPVAKDDVIYDYTLFDRVFQSAM